MKCDKTFFRYSKFCSVRIMLSELALPSFEEIVEKCTCDLRQEMSRSNDDLVSLFLVCLCGSSVQCCVCFSFFLFICIGLATIGSCSMI